VVHHVDEGMVLLPGACACLLARREIRACPTLEHERSGLLYEPPFDCADDDSGGVAFILATKFIGGCDAMEEFLACSVYPLAANAGFNKVAVGLTPVSKLKMSLPKFVAARKDDENDVKFWGNSSDATEKLQSRICH
jgi:hypothetical protein